MKKFSVAAFFCFAIPFICLAHPGHGDTEGYTLIHYFVEPEHAILTYPLLTSFITLFVYRVRRKNDQNKTNVMAEFPSPGTRKSQRHE